MFLGDLSLDGGVRPVRGAPFAAIAARNRRMERYKGEKRTYANAQMLPKSIRKHCAITTEGEKLLENAITRLGLSARAHNQILKVPRTIADQDGVPEIEPKHSSEAIQYRTPDRSYWAYSFGRPACWILVGVPDVYTEEFESHGIDGLLH